MKNARINTDQRLNLSLKAGGASIDMTSIDVLSLYMYCNPQKARDGAIKHSVSTSDAKVLEMIWPADVQRYLGSHSVHGTIRYAGAVASFDIPAVNVVSLTSEADISTDTIVLEAPVGTEDLTATITIQGIGPQGPKGPKGDKMTYADLTQEEKDDLYEGVSEVMKPLLATKQNTLTDTDGGYGQRVAELEKEGIASQEKLTELDAITNALADSLSRILRDFGMYSNPTEYVLAVGVSGKYIDKDSALEVANGNYSISQPISLKAGDILLVPSASAVAAACSVVSKKVTNTYDKVIIYAYTYDEFGRINTATADYNPSLVYTAYYESDEQTTPTNWIRGGEHIAELPETHEVTESFYEPLVKQSVAGMPETGYYVYLASQAMDVVVSAYNATINGGHAIIAGWGIFKNVATNFVGIDKQRVIAEAIADLFAQVEGINEKLTNGLDSLSVKHLHIDRELSGLNIAGTFCLQGAGVPSASVVPVNWDFGRYGDWKGIPQFIGQEYFDTIDKVFYKAHGVTAVSDWKRITNA